MRPLTPSESRALAAEAEIVACKAETYRLRTALKQCGEKARAAFRGDLDESETLSDINNFVIQTLAT